jgi:hypothetical protein
MRRISATCVLLAIGFASTPAFAGGWADFVSAFSTSPCQDGWLGCVVDGQAVTPNLVRDGSGAPTPADLRVGWFDLEGLPGFSPFPELSAYSGKLTGSDPEPPPEPAVAAADPDPVPVRDDRSDTPPPPVADGGSRTGSRGDDGGSRTGSRGDGGSTASGTDTSGRTGSRGGTADAGSSSSVPETNAIGGGTSIRDIGSSGSSDAVKVPTDSAIQTTAAAVDGDCSNIKKLEPMAMLGKLTPEHQKCLEDSIAAAPKQTDKDKISRVLMANAWAANDKAGWEKLVKRHLDEIDRSDPDLCYKYAMHLARKGPGASDAVIKWSDVALENKTIWTGPTYTNRVNGLLKLRADAAQKAWAAAEEKYKADASDANRSARDNARNRTKVLAREWYEYAKETGKGADQAKQLCISAAGTEDYCEGS